ncbi:MAG: hypothetical protein Sapg2KO_11680 [Saprospiraceae bacterium]
MKPYKVIYLPATQLKKSKDWVREGSLDGVTTSTELEALLLEQDKNGYELVSIIPSTGNIAKSATFVNTLMGLIVTLKLKTQK